MASNASTSFDYAYWSLLIAAIALIASIFSVIAEYVGLFRGKLKIPVGEKIMVYETSGEIIGGIVERVSKESVKLKRAYHIDENWTIGTMEPTYFPNKHITEADVPVASIQRWKKLTEDLAKRWDALPD
jgi:hypothetical protein